MPAPPRRPLKQFPRMTGHVTAHSMIHQDMLVRCDQFGSTICVPLPAEAVLRVDEHQRVVFLDQRGGKGFRRDEELMKPARVFAMVRAGHEPVLYVMMGIEPSKPVPEEQAAAARMAAHRYFTHHS